MNEYKANFAWWSIATDVLHDSLTLCNWVWPMTMSPTKARDYRGDLDLEAKFMKAVTGEDVTTEDLYKMGAKITTLQRANTARGMVSANEATWVPTTSAPSTTSLPSGPSPWIRTSRCSPRAPTRWTRTISNGPHHDVRVLWLGSRAGLPDGQCLDYYDMPDVKEDLAALAARAKPICAERLSP